MLKRDENCYKLETGTEKQPYIDAYIYACFLYVLHSAKRCMRYYNEFLQVVIRSMSFGRQFYRRLLQT